MSASMMSTVIKPIHREGWRFIPIFAVVAVVLFFVWQPLGWVGLGLTIWCQPVRG